MKILLIYYYYTLKKYNVNVIKINDEFIEHTVL